MTTDDLEIKPLSPDMADQFTSYLGEMDYSHAEHWHFCYCQYYHVDCTSIAWRQRTAEQNKSLAEENIKNGLMRGLVALDGDQMVGWVNVNDINNYALLATDEELHGFPGSSAMVVCFVIHPDYAVRDWQTACLRKLSRRLVGRALTELSADHSFGKRIPSVSITAYRICLKLSALTKSRSQTVNTPTFWN